MGVNKWDFLSLTTKTVIALKHVAVVVLMDVIAVAIVDVVMASSAEDSTRDVVAKRDLTIVS